MLVIGSSSSSHGGESQWEIQAAQDLHNTDFYDHTPSRAQDQAEAVMLDCLNNIVAIYMKAHEYDKAKQAAAQVLVRDPHNFTGLLELCKATMLDSAGSFEDAQEAMTAANNVAKSADQHAQVEEARMELARRKHQYKLKAKAMFKTMRKSITIQH